MLSSSGASVETITQETLQHQDHSTSNTLPSPGQLSLLSKPTCQVLLLIYFFFSLKLFNDMITDYQGREQVSLL